MRRRRTGFTLIEMFATTGIVVLLLAMLLPAVLWARKTAYRVACANNLRQIGIALATYETVHRVYPFGVGADNDQKFATHASPDSRRFSLQVQILPYLDQQQVYDRISFSVAPFHPDTTGDPAKLAGGPNEAAAQTQIPVFVCPADEDRMSRPWGRNSYRSCSGSSKSGREGDGMFGQITRISHMEVVDGLSHTAAFSERLFGDDDRDNIDLMTDVFGFNVKWTDDSLRQWCSGLTDDQAFGADQQDANSGQTWLEGNMTWTRYNHVLPPGRPSCKGDLTWNGVAMSATSAHSGGVNLLLGDGVVHFMSYNVDETIWRALGTIAGEEQVDSTAY